MNNNGSIAGLENLIHDYLEGLEEYTSKFARLGCSLDILDKDMSKVNFTGDFNNRCLELLSREVESNR